MAREWRGRWGLCAWSRPRSVHNQAARRADRPADHVHEGISQRRDRTLAHHERGAQDHVGHHAAGHGAATASPAVTPSTRAGLTVVPMESSRETELSVMSYALHRYAVTPLRRYPLRRQALLYDVPCLPDVSFRCISLSDGHPITNCPGGANQVHRSGR
jgi:hypothetical protein